MAEPSLSVSCRRRTSRTQYSTVWRRCCVNVEELFRRYLEQRREMGESELVLDGLTVDEVLRIVGAHGKRASAPEPESGGADWRQALRDADAGLARPLERIPRADAPPPAPTPRSPPSAPSAPLAPLAPRPAKISDLAAPGIVVGGGEAELFGGPIARAASLEEIAELVRTCVRCPL